MEFRVLIKKKNVKDIYIHFGLKLLITEVDI